MVEGTTQKGVSGNEGDDPGQPDFMTDATNPRRGPVLDGIIAKRKAQFESDLNAEGGNEPLIPESGQETAPAPDPGPAPGAAKAQQPKPAADGAGAAAEEPMIRVRTADGQDMLVPIDTVTLPTKLDGESREVAAKDVVNGFQMAAVGQARIREGNERLKTAEAREADLTRREAALQAAPAPAAAEEADAGQADRGQQAADDSTKRKERLKKIVEEIQFGDPDDAVTLLDSELSEGRGDNGAATPVDEGQLAERAANIAERRQRMKHDYDENLAAFGRAHPPLINDPMLLQNAAANVHALRVERLEELGHEVRDLSLEDRTLLYMAEQTKGTVPSDRELYLEAGDRTRNSFENRYGVKLDYSTASTETSPAAEPAKEPAQAAQQGFAAKAERKAAAGSPPPVATAFDRPAPEPGRKSRSAVVHEMQAARRGRPLATTPAVPAA